MVTQIPAYLRHDNMCQYRRSQGTMKCDCQIGRRRGDDPYELLNDDQRALLITHLKLAMQEYRTLQHAAEDALSGFRHEDGPERWSHGNFDGVEEGLYQDSVRYRALADEMADLRWEL